MSGDPNVALIIVWAVFAVLMLAGIAVLLVWAVRSRQFADPDRARRLPLESGIPATPAAPPPAAKRKGASHASP
jgi:cbb3-type cytochrome oxidase maturation protein